MKLKTQAPAIETLNSLVLVIAQLRNQTSTPWVDEAFHQSLIQAEVRLREARNKLNTAQDTLKSVAKFRHLKGRVMVKTVRDFYMVLNRAAQRDETNAQWLSVFGGKVEMPALSSLKHPWFEVAKRIAEANQQVKAALKQNAQAFESAPPSSPSAEEVAARLEAAMEADQAWRDAILVAKQYGDELREARKHVQALLTSLRFTMRAKMVGWSHEQRRKVLRVFGFNFDPEANADPATSTTQTPPPTVNPERATA
jgi:hypothetical protein